MKLLQITLSVFLLLSSPPAIARDYVEAFNAYQRGNYAVALRAFRTLAERGDVLAQYELGVMYNNGEGVQQNFGEAIEWFYRAAIMGHAPAQSSLGIKYEKGQGVKRNYREAANWYRRSAEQGYATAQYRLGRMYVLGRGVKRDYIEAVAWFDRAAEQGVQDAAIARDSVAARLKPPQLAAAEKGHRNANDFRLTLGKPISLEGWAEALRHIQSRQTGKREITQSQKQPTPAASAAPQEVDTGVPIGTVKGSSSKANNAWRIQLISLQSLTQAEAAWAELQHTNQNLLANLSLHVQKAELPKGTFYRVQAGPLPDRAATVELCDSLKSQNQDCLVVAP